MEENEPNLRALIAGGMTEDEAAEHVRSVVEQFGEAFAVLAENPRLTFLESEVSIRLWKPITTAEGETHTLTMREPTVAELKKAETVKGSIAQMQRVIVSICNISERESGSIGLRDVTVLAQIVSAFTPAARAIGAKL